MLVAAANGRAMSEPAKITASHLSDRRSFICASPVPPKSSTNRNRPAAIRACSKARDLGWPDERVVVIDEDLGLSGSGAVWPAPARPANPEVALARVGLVLVSKSRAWRATMPNGIA